MSLKVVKPLPLYKNVINPLKLTSNLLYHTGGFMVGVIGAVGVVGVSGTLTSHQTSHDNIKSGVPKLNTFRLRTISLLSLWGCVLTNHWNRW